jgi:hypothetical protein
VEKATKESVSILIGLFHRLFRLPLQTLLLAEESAAGKLPANVEQGLSSTDVAVKGYEVWRSNVWCWL